MEAHHIRAILRRHRLNRYIPRWLTSAAAMALSIVIFIRRLKLDFYSRRNSAFEWISSYEWYWSTYTDIMTATVSFAMECVILFGMKEPPPPLEELATMHTFMFAMAAVGLGISLRESIGRSVAMTFVEKMSLVVSIHQFGIAAIDATYTNLGMERPWKFTTMPVAVLVFLVHVKVVKVILHPPLPLIYTMQCCGNDVVELQSEESEEQIGGGVVKFKCVFCQLFGRCPE